MRKEGLTALVLAAAAGGIFFMKKQNEIDVLARTIWGEARSEGVGGMQAVANVIMNRVAQGGWWGDDVIEVCKKKWQFSAGNPNDPNGEKMLAVTTENEVFAQAWLIAKDAIYGRLKDLTLGSTSYHTEDISPYWADDNKLVTQIGAHKFYAGV